MATELYPSSFRCDCGEELHFSERAIKEMRKMSKKKQVRLVRENIQYCLVMVKQKKYFARS